MDLSSPLVGWLLDSDPAIRWQAHRDLLASPAPVVAAERARVATEGWGARLLELQGGDGQWGGAAFIKNTWTSTFETLTELRLLGIDPASERVRAAVARVRDRVTWGPGWNDSPFFEGEVEPCINGRTLACGAYFGAASERLAARLIGEQLADGGWNCEAPKSQRSSFHTTICVLEGLLEYERARGGEPVVAAARRRAHEYLLERCLFRRRSTGEVIDPGWTKLAFPPRWHYDVLYGLDHLRRAGAPFDSRAAGAVALVESKRDADGRWPLEHRHEGAVHIQMEAVGEPSRWNTLRALRVLEWARARASTSRPPMPDGGTSR
jgi:hypothetical protein